MELIRFIKGVKCVAGKSDFKCRQDVGCITKVCCHFYLLSVNFVFLVCLKKKSHVTRSTNHSTQAHSTVPSFKLPICFEYFIHFESPRSSKKEIFFDLKKSKVFKTFFSRHFPVKPFQQFFLYILQFSMSFRFDMMTMETSFYLTTLLWNVFNRIFQYEKISMKGKFIY